MDQEQVDKAAARIMDRIERDGALHLDSIKEELLPFAAAIPRDDWGSDFSLRSKDGKTRFEVVGSKVRFTFE